MINDDLITNIIIITIVDYYIHYIENIKKSDYYDQLDKINNDDISIKKYLIDLALKEFNDLISHTSPLNFYNKIKLNLDRHLKNNDNKTLL